MGEGERETLKKVFEMPEEGLPCSLVNVQAGERIRWRGLWMIRLLRVYRGMLKDSIGGWGDCEGGSIR